MKIKLVIENNCPNCKYILSQLPDKYKKELEIIEKDKLDKKLKKKIKAVPCLIVRNKIYYLTGNVIGLIKVILLVEKEKDRSRHTRETKEKKQSMEKTS